MATFKDRVLRSDDRPVWIDWTEYAGRLLAAGHPPWLDATAAVAWQKKSQALLRSDVLSIPVERIAAAWIAEHPALREAMAARSRPVYPVKTLLGDEGLRSLLVATVRAMRASMPGPLVALSLPSPRAWVGEAYRQAHDATVDAGDDEADSAALYLADFLRPFGDAGVDVVELVETDATEPACDTDTACYQSVCNVAAHYRWDIGLRVSGRRYDGSRGTFDFITSGGVVPECIHGWLVDAEFWSGQPLPARGSSGFWYATVPADANPEQVLERRSLLG